MIGAFPARPTGSKPEAIFARWVWDTLLQLKTDAPGATRTTRGTYQFSKSSSGVNSKVKQYLLTDASNLDYFVCRTLGAAALIGDADIYIAKPFSIRQTPFDANTVEAVVETWDGATLNTETRTYTYDYKSHATRLKTWTKTDGVDEVTPVVEIQTIIPRFIPAVLDEPVDEPITNSAEGANVIYAIDCSGLDVVGPSAETLTLLALGDGWAWARV